MKVLFRFLSCCAFVFSFSPKAFAKPFCDFDGDGMSEIVFVNANNQGNYDWTAFNPRIQRTKAVISNLGNSASRLIPGNWFRSGKAAAAIVDPVSPEPNGRAIWVGKSLDYLGGTAVVRNLGREGDIIIQGGDYDGNGITDSLILKQTTGMLGLRVNYFIASYNGNNLGSERLYKALGSPFRDRNFFFSPDGHTDYLAVLRRGSNGNNTALKLKPFTDSPQSFSIGALPGGSSGPLPVKQGYGKPDLLAFYAPRRDKTLLTVKTLQGSTIFSRLVVGNGMVTVGDYFDDFGWEIAVQNGTSFTIINPKTGSENVVQGPTGRAISCISNQTIY